MYPSGHALNPTVHPHPVISGPEPFWSLEGFVEVPGLESALRPFTACAPSPASSACCTKRKQMILFTVGRLLSPSNPGSVAWGRAALHTWGPASRDVPDRKSVKPLQAVYNQAPL